MTHPSLRREEAVARAELLDVRSYDVALDLTEDRVFTSLSTIEVASRGGSTFLDVRPVELLSITLDDMVLDPGLLHEGRYPLRLDAGEHRIEVAATMAYRHDGEGLHRSTDAADGRDYVYAMSFMDAAPTMLACFDQPDLKATWTLHVRAPQEWTVVGNGPATNPEPGVWELATTPPLSTYVVTLVAGPWHVLRDEHDGIPLGLSARASLAPHLDREADELFTLTRQCLDELHRLFGIRYPFGDYHQAFVPEFNAGAMENPGCVTLRDSFVPTTRVTRGQRLVRATTVAHEMAHQWFGNLVTPRWWDDLWLNESFAEYLGNRVAADATDFTDAWEDVARARRPWGLVADQRPSTHPVAGAEAPDAATALQSFDGISYAKGSAVLRQISTLIGDEAFFGGAVDLMTRHRFGNASMADLLAAWEVASGTDLGPVTAQWLRTAGPDALWLDRAAGVVRRDPPADHPADRRHVFSVAREQGGTLVLAPERLEVAAPTTPYDGGPGAVVLDPLVETWAASLLDETTVAALPRLLPGVTDPLLLAGTWNALRTTFHRAEVSPAAVLDVVEAALPVEDTGGHTLGWVVERVLPLGPADGSARAHAAALRLVDGGVEAGSERQLAALRFAVATAGGPDGEARLRTWLAGDLPTGVDLDHDLRWRVLVRLATTGAVDRDELDAALAEHRDATTTVEHVRAVASLPDADAKSWAWAHFTGEHTAPNYEVEAAGLGFWRSDQEQLTAPWVERYLAELPATVEVRSGWTLATTASAFFPRTSLEEATLAGALALAADDRLEASLRRRVGDEADDLARRIAVVTRWPRLATSDPAP